MKNIFRENNLMKNIWVPNNKNSRIKLILAIKNSKVINNKDFLLKVY
jgi:hypothetical protein